MIEYKDKGDDSMKTAIVYDSKTGNTKMVAEAIKSVCHDIVYCGPVQENIEAELYFIGSWTDKGNCSERMQTFCKTLHNKKIAIFGTCGFGGSYAYIETLAKRFISNFAGDNEIMGNFYCMGKMPMTVRERYVSMLQTHPEDTKLAVSIENFDEALVHPDNTDIENAKMFAKNIIEAM